MTEKSIQKILWEKYKSHKYKILNAQICNYREIADFISVTQSGYCQEIEIKLSKSDFQADFRKPKHKLMKSKPSGWNKKVANRFYFAVPKGLISKKDVPRYAGLIYIYNNKAEIIKKAPLLHKTKRKVRLLFFNKVYYFYENSINREFFAK